MPMTLQDLQRTNYLPLADFYARAGVTPDLLAKVRKEALEAKTGKILKVKGVMSSALLPSNVSIIGFGHEETVLLHTTVDHRTRLEAAEAVAQEMGLKPAKRVDVNMAASEILGEILKEIDGSSLGIPSSQAAEGKSATAVC